ncbi:MAG TPA: DNA repair protein RecN [Clostridiaceae bacterium]|jgi:DNA repair protein RecN (Recombination protein N)|nr:DNA repair protein RecN [Clostridiaceae bacterium]
MLIQLEVENVAIIEKIKIPLQEGFTVLTGETGAGKSIIIDSLNALLGSRVSRDLIRSGAKKAFVQGLFSYDLDNYNKLDELLDSMGIEPQDDRSILISRTFTETGKNICRVNGTMVTVGMLKEIGQRLVDIHGQHDNQSLLRADTHIELLDLFAGDRLAAQKAEYRTSLRELNSLKEKLRALAGVDKERERTLDILRYQIDEIEAARLYTGEDAELESKTRILAHAEDIILAFSNAYQWLRGDDGENHSALDKVGLSLEAIRKIEDLDPDYMNISNALEDINEKLTDISREIRILRDGTEYDPNLHKNIEERISLIQGLKRKYGETIEEILEFLDDAKRRLDEIERSEELIIKIRKEIEAAEKSLHKRCGIMNGLRREAAKKLEEGILRELKDLEMPKTQFEVSILSCPEEGFTENGTDKVEFLFSPNMGEPLKPLSKIASGGEMSRVMLAIKTILADIDDIPTLVFDEIDTGVSGKAASKLGEKLKTVAKGHQVICITHHAQIASQANTHYLIEKDERDGRTLTLIRQLEGIDRENEIIRLLSGEHATEAAKKLARELLVQG